jgi:2-dehydro-3-deoxygluconokinase
MAQVVTFGEIMMRLSTPNNSRFAQSSSLNVIYGGGEANMSVALAQLGISAKHVTVFPDNDLGKAATAYYNKLGVEMDVHFEGDRLGLYFLETGAGARSSRIVYDRYNSAFSFLQPEWFNWNEILKGAEWFLFTGITPAVSASAADACLQAVKVAKSMGVKVLGDVNYRRNLWKYGKTVQEILPQFMPYIDVAICSEGDAADILNIHTNPANGNTFAQMSQQIQQQYPNVTTVISTRRSSVSASENTLFGVAYCNDEYVETPVYEINGIVDRIGSGDAFAGAFIFGLNKYNNVLKALNFGTAAAVLKHTIEGDANLASLAEIETVMSGDTSGRLLR